MRPITSTERLKAKDLQLIMAYRRQVRGSIKDYVTVYRDFCGQTATGAQAAEHVFIPNTAANIASFWKFSSCTTAIMFCQRTPARFFKEE